MAVNKNSNALKVVGTIFAGVGLILVAVGVGIGNHQYTILKSWPVAEAAVTRSRVRQYISQRGRRMYETEIEFRYTVDGKAFDTPSSPGYSTSSYSSMKSIADEFAPGTRHLIRYNPSEPSDIRMNAGYNFGFFFLPVLMGGLGAFFAALGIVLRFASRSVQPLLCPACGQTVERGQRFCPNCAAPLTTGTSPFTSS